MIRNIMLVDVETSSVDPNTGSLLEVAMGIWSVPNRALIRARSWLCFAEQNEAVAVNGLRPELLRVGIEAAEARRQVHHIATKEADVVSSWNWAFDRQWLPELHAKPSFCSMDDVEWPRPSSSKSLTAMALAHGVGVVSAHRALTDVMTMVHLYDRVAEMHDIEALLARALRPRAVFEVADKRFDEARNAKAKELGFRWDAPTKSWRKRMAVEDVATMPFAVRQVQS